MRDRDKDNREETGTERDRLTGGEEREQKRGKIKGGGEKEGRKWAIPGHKYKSNFKENSVNQKNSRI